MAAGFASKIEKDATPASPFFWLLGKRTMSNIWSILGTLEGTQNLLESTKRSNLRNVFRNFCLERRFHRALDRFPLLCEVHVRGKQLPHGTMHCFRIRFSGNLFSDRFWDDLKPDAEQKRCFWILFSENLSSYKLNQNSNTNTAGRAVPLALPFQSLMDPLFER